MAMIQYYSRVATIKAKEKPKKKLRVVYASDQTSKIILQNRLGDCCDLLDFK